jgi:hypothetical protein
MTIENVHDIADSGESSQVEFKRTTGTLSAAAKTVCGMSHGEGGYILISVGTAWSSPELQLGSHLKERSGAGQVAMQGLHDAEGPADEERGARALSQIVGRGEFRQPLGR